MKKYFSLFMVLALASFSLPAKKKIKIFLAGDSTMSIKEIKAYPETGWGMPFANMFDSTVTVDNRAKNGRSTKTFISEGLWDALIKDVQADDYVFIQFAHNDEVKEKKSYATPVEFHDNLVRFIKETRAKNAHPVLLTPVARRKFDASGKIVDTHVEYAEITRSVAKEMNVLLIDMSLRSMELLQQFGEEKSKLLFMQVEPGEHPNYPEGKIDNTHFDELGARKMAQLVVKEIRTLIPELADRIVKPAKN
jgi:lysophospholipase L1-like esterase